MQIKLSCCGSLSALTPMPPHTNANTLSTFPPQSSFPHSAGSTFTVRVVCAVSYQLVYKQFVARHTGGCSIASASRVCRALLRPGGLIISPFCHPSHIHSQHSMLVAGMACTWLYGASQSSTSRCCFSLGLILARAALTCAWHGRRYGRWHRFQPPH